MNGISTLNSAISTINTGVSTINNGVSNINNVVSNATNMNALGAINGMSALNSDLLGANGVANGVPNAIGVANANAIGVANANGVPNAIGVENSIPNGVPNANAITDTSTTIDTDTISKVFDVDSNINSGLYTIVVIIAYMMIIMFVIIFLNAIVNYIIFQYYNINNMLLESDVYNLDKKRYGEVFEYGLVDYVYCSKKSSEEEKGGFDFLAYILNDEPKKDGSCMSKLHIDDALNTFKTLLRSNKCSIEPYWNIYGENKFHTLCMQFLYLITVILLIGSTIYILARIFLSMRQWNVRGTNLISYFYKNGELYAYIILLVIVFCILHSFLFKFLFVDNIYEKLYKNYEELIKLDAYVHNELKNIDDEKIFLNLLSNSTIHNIDIEDELNTHNKKILDSIKDSKNDEVRATKIFLYAIYIYFKRQNPENIEIISIITNIATSNPENVKTLRSLLMCNIDNKAMSSALNNIISIILLHLGLNGEYEIFDYNKYSEWVPTSLNYKVAYKINQFYEIIMKMTEKLDLKRSVWDFNIYFIIMLVKSLVFLLLLFTLLYVYADKDPFFKKVVSWVIRAINEMIDDMKWTMVM